MFSTSFHDISQNLIIDSSSSAMEGFGLYNKLQYNNNSDDDDDRNSKDDDSTVRYMMMMMIMM
jgi:hypothetical protein